MAMGTIQDKLSAALASKRDIKAAIEEKDGSVTDFASYADAIRNIKGSGEEHSPVRFSAEFADGAVPYLNSGLMGLFGSSVYDVRKLTICGIVSELYYYYEVEDLYDNVRDLTIDNKTYYFGQNSRSIVRIGKAVHDGNLRLEGEWSDIPEELLDAFIGWELYINGEHIGTITPKVEGGYYYTESKKHDYYAGDGYNGTFKFDAGAGNDYLIFYDGIPQELLDACYYGGKTIISNRGEEGISRSNGASLYICKKEGVVEWLDIK